MADRLRKHFFVLALCGFLAATAAAQELPDRILGYKVYKQTVRVISETDPTPAKDKKIDASVTMGRLETIGLSALGVTVRMPGKILANRQSGSVDFLTFHDFTVNGIAVDIERYEHPFEFKKEVPVDLPEPISVYLRADRLLAGAWSEISGSKAEWRVKGRVFVFGEFRKVGMDFKRVVPIDIDLTIPNPIRGRGDSGKLLNSFSFAR
jgi:hypothetical protein